MEDTIFLCLTACRIRLKNIFKEFFSRTFKSPSRGRLKVLQGRLINNFPKEIISFFLRLARS